VLDAAIQRIALLAAAVQTCPSATAAAEGAIVVEAGLGSCFFF
jgi:hypothetical protein